ncbi:M20/M25/M40 family metallo-hydrolase [Phenylobacterium sp.]|uniref:M20/M25/M40 family metallo-hydrolase n=1 Tax=Phenylobacterium sp. TaxID=1871053 RepID=UPI002F954B8D
MLKTAAFAALLLATPAAAQQPGLVEFRSLYKELVETNTAPSAGSCTVAAQRMAARLKAAGFPDSDVKVLVPTERDGRDGNLVAVYPGRDAKAPAILLLAHIDVVEAKREDWTRDPFTLMEEDGRFYARGASDDKAQAAIFTDLFIRLRKEGYKPRRTLKLALTCGEEGGSTNGVRWLLANHKGLLDAGMALNEGAGGRLGPNGKPVVHTILAAEKTSMGFTLEATNPGGHSSRPSPDNAIYHIARAIDAISRHSFPIQLNDANRGYLQRMAPVEGGERGAAMKTLAANPQDPAAAGLLSGDIEMNATLRTTCVATMMEAGHAPNALPQRARATINCRVMPGVPAAEIRDTLIRVIDNPKVTVSEPPARDGRSAGPPPLSKEVLGPIEKISQTMWPGVPIVPILQPAATDAKPMNDAGIPTYGVSGIFYEPDLGRIHGLNESILVKSLYEGREFTYRLVKAYADQR